jgi:hypothetical protein
MTAPQDQRREEATRDRVDARTAEVGGRCGTDTCIAVSSDDVVLGPVTADQNRSNVWYCLAKSGGVGTWFGTGLQDVSPTGGTALAIGITDDTMTLGIGNRAVATARFSKHAAVG